jgi:DNA-binding SARP family transcriptional activator
MLSETIQMTLAPKLDIHLLGAFRVRVGERVIHASDWRLRKAQNLVKLLGLAPAHRLQRDQVTELLWPELPSDAATNNLHKTVYMARHALQPDLTPAVRSEFIHLEWNALVLASTGGLEVDVEGFERAAALARETADPDAYAAALRLYAGELLPEDRYEDWAVGRRDVLEQQYLALLVEMAAIQERSGQHHAAIEGLSRVVAREPIHEEAHVALMRLYSQIGQRHLALREYRQMRAALQRELDLEPSPISTQLYRAIATGELAAA